MRIIGTAIALSLAFGATPARAGAEEDLLATAQDIYAPYSSDEFLEGAVWDRPIFSPDLVELIAEWEAGLSEDEVEDLNGFDWLCVCQDYDAAKFRAVFTVQTEANERLATIEVKLNLGWDGDEMQQSSLLMMEDNGRWKIFDMFSEAFEAGLAQELEWAIEDHEAGL